MKRHKKTKQEQEAIIAEYLLGEKTYRQLTKEHEVDFRVIHSWVTKFKGKPMSKQKIKTSKQHEQPLEPLPIDVKQLQEELRKAKLYNELLNTMIDIAEGQLKINIRKKSGTKQ